MNYYNDNAEFSHAYDCLVLGDEPDEPTYCGDETVIPIEAYEADADGGAR
jgi:hypothetical protein